ncbi:hypothetical protein PHYPSEUDO_014295 [Phytophthora pseudosyringae]|uniref:Uncharacterized protein n=1 Tax=Phytophthora pseudosyringae TaxID=221518 RepID=A0A8T1WJZ8_9STRA|nr:hypothetical protein PHYPSEUDO_014295 [Phytophthora pseudosyringae]
MASSALEQFLLMVRRRLAARAQLLRQCRRRRTSVPDLQFQAPTTGSRGLLDSVLDNEAAMKSYADEINLNRIRSLSSEDRQALARRRSHRNPRTEPTLPSLKPRRPHIEHRG